MKGRTMRSSKSGDGVLRCSSQKEHTAFRVGVLAAMGGVGMIVVGPEMRLQ